MVLPLCNFTWALVWLPPPLRNQISWLRLCRRVICEYRSCFRRSSVDSLKIDEEEPETSGSGPSGRHPSHEATQTDSDSSEDEPPPKHFKNGNEPEKKELSNSFNFYNKGDSDEDYDA